MSSPHSPAQVAWTLVRTLRAITVRTLIARAGPKPTWDVMLRDGRATEVQTVYGAVVALSRAWHDQQKISPRLTGPSALADRAYLMDAVLNLTDHGYTRLDPEYKPGTAQITRIRMRVPPEDLARAQRLTANRTPYARLPDGTTLDVPGHPWMYARCSGGGITLPALKRLVHRHHMDISTWWSPLIVVVPREGDLRGYLRALDARERHLIDTLRRDRIFAPHYEPAPTVHLIVQPLPSLITRPSAHQ